jgi:hypothetical protein
MEHDETRDYTTLDWVSMVTEINDVHEFMQDEVVDEAMALIVKLCVKSGSVPPNVAAKLVVHMQALAAQCAIKAKYYTVLNKDSQKKNIYYTLEDALNNLVNAIKYSLRMG